MASKFKKIDPRLWSDERFVKLDPLSKLDAIYGITAQSNRIGIFKFSAALAAEDLGTLPPTFRERFRNVCRTLFWGWDEELRVLYLPTWWKYNQPENPNVLRACLSDLDDLPQSPLVAKFCENVRFLKETLRPTFLERIGERYPQRSPHHEHEHEHEHEQKHEHEQAASLPPNLKNGHPTIDDVRAYCLERGNKVDPEKWFDHYASNGWKVGKNPMKDWKAAVRTWEKNEFSGKPKGKLLTGPAAFAALDQKDNRE